MYSQFRVLIRKHESVCCPKLRTRPCFYTFTLSYFYFKWVLVVFKNFFRKESISRNECQRFACLQIRQSHYCLPTSSRLCVLCKLTATSAHREENSWRSLFTSTSFFLLYFFQTIKDVDLQALGSLEYINLSRNLIREIMPGTFLGMANLKGLDFSVNVVRKVRHIYIFSHYFEFPACSFFVSKSH